MSQEGLKKPTSRDVLFSLLFGGVSGVFMASLPNTFHWKHAGDPNSNHGIAGRFLIGTVVFTLGELAGKSFVPGAPGDPHREWVRLYAWGVVYFALMSSFAYLLWQIF
jgi:hypothetical protein